MSYQEDIEKEIIQGIVAATDDVTYFGQGGVLRAIARAFAIPLANTKHDLEQIRKELFIHSSKTDALDILGDDRGISRPLAAAAGVKVVFGGTVSTVIPKDTEVESVDGVIFKTQEAVTIATLNADLLGLSTSLPLSDKADCIANVAGIAGNVDAGHITKLVTPITGVTYVNNPLPGEGGVTLMADPNYRYLLWNYISSLNLNTAAFFLAQAQLVDEKVLRLKVSKPDRATVDMILVNTAGIAFTTDELNKITLEVENKSRGSENITSSNISFTNVDVVFTTLITPGVTLNQAFANVADKLANYLNWQTWTWGEDVDDVKLLDACNEADGIENIDLSTFTPSSDVVVTDNSLPKLNLLTITSSDGTSKSSSLVTSYE